MDKFSYLSNVNGAYIEDVYLKYLQGDEYIEDSWRKFFDGYQFAQKNFSSNSKEIPLNVQKEFMVIRGEIWIIWT